MGVSVTVLSLWVQRGGGGSETQRNPPEKSFKKETCVWSYFGFFMAEFNRATRSSSSLTEWCQWRELLVHLFFVFLENVFSSSPLTVCKRRGLAGPESALLSACLQDPLWFKTQTKSNDTAWLCSIAHQAGKPPRNIDYFLTHLIEALVHQLDQRRRINIGVYFHGPVALDYFHAEVQRVLQDKSKNIKTKKKYILYLYNE